jgi:hypothetical protein
MLILIAVISSISEVRGLLPHILHHHAHPLPAKKGYLLITMKYTMGEIGDY